MRSAERLKAYLAGAYCTDRDAARCSCSPARTQASYTSIVAAAYGRSALGIGVCGRGAASVLVMALTLPSGVPRQSFSADRALALRAARRCRVGGTSDEHVPHNSASQLTELTSALCYARGTACERWRNELFEMTSVLVYGSPMTSSSSIHTFVFPVVRELAGPSVDGEVPPERRVTRPSQRNLVAASLIACPDRASGSSRRG